MDNPRTVPLSLVVDGTLGAVDVSKTKLDRRLGKTETSQAATPPRPGTPQSTSQQEGQDAKHKRNGCQGRRQSETRPTCGQPVSP